ncbi:hypothetical protein [uncultured Sphingomonas sp.]|uniref:hypothetical protein n=1 Tax=uncultured Sphingomonas sp. TaxID=158754 RepID=UPI0035CA5BA3
MTDSINHPETARRPLPIGRRGKFALVGAGLLALGGAAGAVVMAESRPQVTMAPVQPIAIRALASDEIVTIRGRVAEIYGNNFIMADASGRALVETGREGEDGKLVTIGEPVTVQGRFDRGVVHAAFLVAPGNKITALGPLGGPRQGRHGSGDPLGDDHGPGRDGPPPMPAPRGAAAPPSAAQ